MIERSGENMLQIAPKYNITKREQRTFDEDLANTMQANIFRDDLFREFIGRVLFSRIVCVSYFTRRAELDEREINDP